MGEQEGAPAWATERLHLAEPSSEWCRLGEVFAAEVQLVLGPWLISEVEHVGSTAVPGLPAKPVIDLQATAASPDVAVEAAMTRLAAGSWHVVPRELDQRPWRRFVVRTDPDGRRRLAHLHLMPPGAARWQEQIEFRDRLRADPALAGRYARLKAELATRHAHDRETYTDAKASFVARVLDQRRASYDRASAPAVNSRRPDSDAGGCPRTERRSRV